MRRLILQTIRLLGMAALGLIIRNNGPRRYQHLLHYLQGSGEGVDVGGEFTAPTTARMLDHTVRVEGQWLCQWWHSLNYEGRGFWQRPELFYLIGGFTSSIKVDGGGRVKAQGKDVYDWHPSADGEWFTSSIPNLGKYPNRCVKAVWKVLGFLGLGHYFPTAGLFESGPCISNRLWADLEKVGARPFCSTWDIEFQVEQKTLLSFLKTEESERTAVVAVELQEDLEWDIQDRLEGWGRF